MSTEPIAIPGADRYLRSFYLPQLFATDPSKTNTVFNQLLSNYIQSWIIQPRNRTMEGLKFIGYKGPGVEFANSSDSFWSSNGSKTDAFYAAIKNLANYDPVGLWKNWDGDVNISSTYDIDTLRKNLEALNDPANNPNPPLWYPTFLYTYGQIDEAGNRLGTSYPGPTLIAQPGNTLNLHFKNNISIPGLSSAELQQATLVRNSSYGNSGSDGLAGSTSLNYHLHGSHTNPGGFGDNVVARYTTGQEWTTVIGLPVDHASGSYWYHPHYHPSVNQQVYGGLSGFLQLGDPLSKVPDFKDIPRNLAILKNIDLAVDPESGELRITSLDGSGAGAASNQMTMVTVNGEFQPTVDGGAGGWQAITLSNQTNQAFYNISFVNTDKEGKTKTLPIYLYGEDGHQYPQILAAKGTLGTSGSGSSTLYAQQANLLSLPPGKRLDALIYLPQGLTQIASTYSFTKTPDPGGTRAFRTANMGGYPDLIASNTIAAQGINTTKPTGAGPLALFRVDDPVAPLSVAEQNAAIAQANAGISVQAITPDTRPEQYDPNSVPSINLFAEDSQGQPIWRPVRDRQFNWAKGTLVGPAEEWDGATQALLKQYSEASGQTYQRYTALPVGQPGVDSWLGYDKPFLINDHVFPNGNLTIAQLGTIEQWTLRNWSVNTAEKYIGHPFHIHINDYQTLDSDTELVDKHSLEDVTMLNSSGFKYYNSNFGSIVSAEPLRGSFHEIPEALDPNTVDNLATWGANDQTIRMLFQDYLGTYVFHCHILPHEDAGMMQAVTVVENTDSSWLLPADGLRDLTRRSAGGRQQRLTIHEAQNYNPVTLNLRTSSRARLERGQAGDVSGDFVQDVVISSSGDGLVRIVDGSILKQKGQSTLLSTLRPYESNLAPWAYAEDFSGDGQRDLVTGGFVAQAKNGSVSLHDFRIKAWANRDGGRGWHEEFAFDPWDFITHHGTMDGPHAMADHTDHAMDDQGHGDGQDVEPVAGLRPDQVGFVVGDFNLDNFNDFALAYAVKGGMRVTILDGAAFTLLYQTGQLEGGYFPDQNLLADAVVLDDSLRDLKRLTLSSGFNSYAQSALENLLVTTDSPTGRQQLTLQLEAGHFIATSDPSTVESHQHGGTPMGPLDDKVVNLSHDRFPLHLISQDRLPDPVDGSTPIISSALGTGGLLLDRRLLVAQGNGVNGIDSSSDQLIGTSQQLVVDLDGLRQIDQRDLAGVVIGWSSNRASTLQRISSGRDRLTLAQTQERNNLANLLAITYAGALPLPGTVARLAADLAAGESAPELVNHFLSDPVTGAESTAHFRGPLENLPTDQITGITYATLYGRDVRARELRVWEEAVANGLDRDLLPLAILQTTSGADRFRLAFLSGSAQWNDLQWGQDANVVGSFGQGFESSEDRFRTLSDSALHRPAFSGWSAAQASFDQFQKQSIDLLGGTPVSDSGFF